MQQKSSRVFLCSLGLPNHFIFSLHGAFCERVLRPRFENEPVFKLDFHPEKLVMRAQLSKHLHRASSLWPGSTDWRQGAGRRENTAGLAWVDSWSLLEILPCGLGLSAGGTSFALHCVWFLALGFWGDTICASLVMQASPEHGHRRGGRVFFFLLQT